MGASRANSRRGYWRSVPTHRPLPRQSSWLSLVSLSQSTKSSAGVPAAPLPAIVGGHHHRARCGFSYDVAVPDRSFHSKVAGQTTSMQMWSGLVRRYAPENLAHWLKCQSSSDRVRIH